MNNAAIEEAARLLADARQTRTPLDRLPGHCVPDNPDEAYAIEIALLGLLKEKPAGWKVALSAKDGLSMGLLLSSRVFESGARIATDVFAMRGVEAEIAFRVQHPLPPRAAPYHRSEIEAAVVALPVIEIVDTRFRSYEQTPALERVADFMSNGALVAGSAEGSAAQDFSRIVVSVKIDGQEVVRKTGGHPSGDPLLPAIALVNHLRHSSGVEAGMIVTTGSYTGMWPGPELCRIEIGFEGLGEASCDLIR